ncbi:MAG: SGNH/GDSL hydrolase family protein [Myxococcota bacterium]
MKYAWRYPLVHAATLALAPLLFLQGRWTRARTPRLPDAPGAAEGTHAGDGDAVRLLVVGESPVAGVGHGSHESAIGGQLGAALAQVSGRTVWWKARGITGTRVMDYVTTLQREDWQEHADVCVVVFGVNDTTGLRSPTQFSRDMHTLLATLRTRVTTSRGAVLPLMLAGVPPLHAFPALPQPLRTVMGWRSACLDASLAELAGRTPHAAHVPTPIRDDGDFVEDGYHPGPVGCRDWARMLAPHLWGLMQRACRSG